MRFIVRTVFWLGLVYHAMPWGDAKLSDVAPAVAPALTAVAAMNGSDTQGSLTRAVLRGALDLASPANPTSGEATTARPQPASLDTLTPEDRRAPWRGPPLRLGT